MRGFYKTCCRGPGNTPWEPLEMRLGNPCEYAVRTLGISTDCNDGTKEKCVLEQGKKLKFFKPPPHPRGRMCGDPSSEVGSPPPAPPCHTSRKHQLTLFSCARHIAEHCRFWNKKSSSRSILVQTTALHYHPATLQLSNTLRKLTSINGPHFT